MNREQVEALIQEQIIEAVAEEAPKQSVFMQLARRLPDMTSRQAKLPVLDLLPMSYWVGGDSGVKQTSEQAWENVFLTAAELAVIVPIPEAVLNDASFDIIGQITPRIIESFGQRVDAAAIFGVNRPVEWQSDLITLARNAGNNVSGGITYDTLMGKNGLIAKVEQAGALVDGVIASIGARAELRSLMDSSDRPLYVTDMKGGSSQYALDGAPMYFPQNGSFDTGVAQIVAGNFASAVYSIRQDVTIKLLDQATIIDPGTREVVYNLAQQDMIAVRAVMRMGWALPNPATRLDPDRANVPFAYIEAASGATTARTVTFTVQSGGTGVVDATVNIGGVRKKTDASGKAVFSLHDGAYPVKVTKSGYTTKLDSVVVAGTAVNSTVELNATSH